MSYVLLNGLPLSSNISCPPPTPPKYPTPAIKAFLLWPLPMLSEMVCSPVLQRFLPPPSSEMPCPLPLTHSSSAPLLMFSEMFCPPCSSDHLPAPSPLKLPASLPLGPTSWAPLCSAPCSFPVIYTFSNFLSFLFSSLFFPFSLFSFFFSFFFLFFPRPQNYWGGTRPPCPPAWHAHGPVIWGK